MPVLNVYDNVALPVTLTEESMWITGTSKIC